MAQRHDNDEKSTKRSATTRAHFRTFALSLFRCFTVSLFRCAFSRFFGRLRSSFRSLLSARRVCCLLLSARLGSLSLTMVRDDIKIIFILGGPGAGKGTQCARLVARFPQLAHFSAGDLLRAERNNPASSVGDLINTFIRDGKIVPSHITIGLLKTAIEGSPASVFLIDGFPRNIEQGQIFEEQIKPCSLVIHLSADEAVCTDRILGRAAESGRVDDNLESLRKRFVTHREECLPVVGYYAEAGKVAEVCATNPKQTTRLALPRERERERENERATTSTTLKVAC